MILKWTFAFDKLTQAYFIRTTVIILLFYSINKLLIKYFQSQLST